MFSVIIGMGDGNPVGEGSSNSCKLSVLIVQEIACAKNQMCVN